MKLAVFHNLPSGGAKRALYQGCRILSRGYPLTGFVPATADEAYCPLGDFMQVQRYSMRASPGAYARLVCECGVPAPMLALPRVRRLAQVYATQVSVAQALDASSCDMALVEQDRYVCSPFVLRRLATPHLYYCQQPFRSSREAVLDRLYTERHPERPQDSLRGRLGAGVDGALARLDAGNAGFSRAMATNSYFSRESILRAYGRDAWVVPLGVDESVFRPLHVDRGDYVLSVGSLLPAKGFAFIVHALGNIPASRRPRLVIVSNAVLQDERRFLGRQASKSGVDLTILTMVSDDELVGFYNRALLVVYAPYLEPFGLVPLEAMASGTPVVAVKEGGVRETLDDPSTGMLVDRDEAAFADAVEQLVADPVRRDTMGLRGVEAVRACWTAEHAAERLHQSLLRAQASQRDVQGIGRGCGCA